MKLKVLILFITTLYVYILFNRQDEWKHTPFEWDRMGYYSYLPAIFIYNDPGNLSFYPEIIGKYPFAGNNYWYATHLQPNGRRLNKYAIGTCIFHLPFFVAAHGYAQLSKAYPADGFSHPYQMAVAFSTIFWVMLGLFLLGLFLRQYFGEPVVMLTLMCIALGTNLYDYTAFMQGLSHPLSFFCFCGLLFATDRLYRLQHVKYFYLLAILLGLITITRPINIIVAIIPLLWCVNNLDTLKERISFWGRYIRNIVFSIIIFTAILFIQLSYWKYVTGHWVYFSYQGEGFDFLHPKLWKGLFSWRKGWFVYTPIALAGVAGLAALWRKDKTIVPVTVLFLTVMVYAVFSWKNWYYGGSFGCRPLIETLAIISIPLAALIERAVRLQNTALKLSFFTVLFFLVLLNMFQTFQHSKNIIHFDRMTKVYYWKVFGTTKYNPELQQYLMDLEEYQRENESFNDASGTK